MTFAKRYGIANGYLDGTFRPEQPVSRAELVKLIASYFTVEGGTSPFPDVPDGHWAAEVVSFAAEEGWVSGYPDGTFRPDAPVSRAEAVKILNHALDRRAGSGPRPCPLPTWRRATGPAMRSGRRRSPTSTARAARERRG